VNDKISYQRGQSCGSCILKEKGKEAGANGGRWTEAENGRGKRKGGGNLATVPVDDLISNRVDIVEKLSAGEGVGAIGALEASGDVESDRLEEYALK
jgi:hypothetical protein